MFIVHIQTKLNDYLQSPLLLVEAQLLHLLHQLKLLHQILVDHHNGLVTIIVMMKITTQSVVGMVVIVVVTMSTHNTALPVNA